MSARYIVMIVVYIIGGLFFLGVSIYLLDRREKMTHEIKAIKEKRYEIEESNRQLDELQEQLDALNGPLSQLNEVSKKILRYMK